MTKKIHINLMSAACLIWLLLVCALMFGCTTVPPRIVTRTQTVEVATPSYVPLSASLLVPVPKPMPPDGAITNKDLLDLAIDRGDAIDQANSQIGAIRKLQPRTK